MKKNIIERMEMLERIYLRICRKDIETYERKVRDLRETIGGMAKHYLITDDAFDEYLELVFKMEENAMKLIMTK